jgi:uncharacterized protein (DUF983 family)
MATVTKSWIETTCPKCACRRVFLLTEGWVLVCSVCGTQKKIEKNGIVPA